MARGVSLSTAAAIAVPATDGCLGRNALRAGAAMRWIAVASTPIPNIVVRTDAPVGTPEMRRSPSFTTRMVMYASASILGRSWRFSVAGSIVSLSLSGSGGRDAHGAIVNHVGHDQRGREEDQAEDEVPEEAVSLAGGDASRPEGDGHHDAEDQDCDKNIHDVKPPLA